MQAKVRDDYSQGTVTAALTNFVKTEWRKVPEGWEERIATYSDLLEFRDGSDAVSKLDEPGTAGESLAAKLGTFGQTVWDNAFKPSEPPAPAPAPAYQPSYPGDTPAADAQDAQLEQQAEADDRAADQADQVASSDRAAAAAKRAERKAGK